MLVAQEIFEDLEFYQCRNFGAKPVFKFIDYCRTDGGREYLKKLFKNSPAKQSEIIGLQNITKFLGEEFGTAEIELPGKLHAECEEYLGSNYVAFDLSGSVCPFFKGIYRRARHPALFAFIQRGIRLLLSSISMIAAIFSELRRKNPPEDVANLFEEYLTVYLEAGLDRIDSGVAGAPAHRVFAVDFLLREQHRDKIQKLLALIAKFDGHLSMGRATALNGFAFPRISADGTEMVAITGLYHPFLENPVKNDFNLEKDRNFMFLTGPNMAGKTTYLKALGISLILAHAGMGVPVATMTFTPFDHLFFQLTVQDDLRRGISSFFQEISQVKRITEIIDAGHRIFVVIDEIFKGTNVSDALECSKIVINGFAGLRQHCFVISSHLYELETAISHNRNIVFAQFETLVHGTGLEFPHRIIAGVSNTRIGTRLLEAAGLTRYFSCS